MTGYSIESNDNKGITVIENKIIKVLIFISVLSSFFLISGCSQKENNIKAFLEYFYTFDRQSEEAFFERFNNAEGFEEMVILLDEKYEPMMRFSSDYGIDVLRKNRFPIGLWKFLYDNDMDMSIKNIDMTQIKDNSYDFSVTIDISRENETLYSGVQEGSIILDKNNKVDKTYFQNVKEIWEIRK